MRVDLKVKEANVMNEECGNVEMWKCENDGNRLNPRNLTFSHFHIFTFPHSSYMTFASNLPK